MPILPFSSAITSRDREAVGAGGEGQRHAVLQHRLGEVGDVVERGREAAVDQGAGADGEHQRLARARAGAPGDGVLELRLALARPGRADEVEDRLDHRLADRHAADELLDRLDALGVEHALGMGLGGAGGLEQHAPLGLAVGIDDVDLEEEAVELRLGEGIGALLLERVLGGEHMERRRQVVAHAGDGDVMLLHRLQQRRLGARAGAVDLVGHQELGEDRAGHEAEGAAAVGGRRPSPRSRGCRTASGRG